MEILGFGPEVIRHLYHIISHSEQRKSGYNNKKYSCATYVSIYLWERISFRPICFVFLLFPSSQYICLSVSLSINNNNNDKHLYHAFANGYKAQQYENYNNNCNAENKWKTIKEKDNP